MLAHSVKTRQKRTLNKSTRPTHRKSRAQLHTSPRLRSAARHPTQHKNKHLRQQQPQQHQQPPFQATTTTILTIQNASFFSSLFNSVKSKINSISKDYDQFHDEQVEQQKRQQLVQRISTKQPTTPEEQALYDKMTANHKTRYEDGEYMAMMSKRKEQLLKDNLEQGVFHMDPNTIFNQIDKLNQSDNSPHTKREVKEIRVVKNADGTVSFTTAGPDVDDNTPTITTNTTTDTQDTTNHATTSKTQVPVNGEFTTIGQIDDPRMLISFLCDLCNHRNIKSISKRSYERGVVLIRCECNADHLISDGLGWFDDSENLTIERILKEDKGQDVFKASVLDLNKNIDFDNAPNEITHDTISPQLYEKIQETLRIAREQDSKPEVKFKHFQSEDALDAAHKDQLYYLESSDGTKAPKQ